MSYLPVNLGEMRQVDFLGIQRKTIAHLPTGVASLEISLFLLLGASGRAFPLSPQIADRGVWISRSLPARVAHSIHTLRHLTMPKKSFLECPTSPLQSLSLWSNPLNKTNTQQR